MSREGAPSEHRRALDRGKPDPTLPRLRVHCAACNEVASVLQIDDGQFISYWDGYRWFGLAAACRQHGFLVLDAATTVTEYYKGKSKPDGVSHCWVSPAVD